MAEVKFKFVGDDSELRKKLANLSKIQSEMTDKFSKDLNEALSNSKSQVFKDITKDAAHAAVQAERLNKIAANKALVNSKLEQIESIRRLREERDKEISNLITLKQIESEARTVLAEKKLITESLTQSEKALHSEYLKTGKDLNTYTLKLKEQAEERRKANQAEREAEKALKASEKARKDAEREAAKQAKETERRKKQLEQESSEYYKLNKALGAVRKETKDVLAEMFRMERQGHANTLGYEALKKKSEDLTKQTLYLDRGIKKIDSTLGLHQRNVGNYGSAIELLGPQFESINQKLSLFGTSIDDLANKPSAIKELGLAVAGLGKQLWALVTTPVGALLATLGALFALFQSNKQTVIDFNSGLRNVSKTTGIAGDDLNDFGDAIIDLSMKLKVIDSTKLLEYATVAGQLGVKGRADILAFTEALAMLETASDIKGEEGATEIARMLTLVDGGVQNVKAFGDEIVNLGNNFAATEKEILANAEQIAQNVGIYKIGRQDVLAFATATKAVGLEAELVGSTFSRTLGEFEKTIRSGKGVADLLKIIGGTSQELSKRFKEDAAGVFVDYVRGLNEINTSGGSVNEALERTGIIAVRDQRVIASLATNGFDVLTDALEKVTTAQGAMQAEFENGAGKLEQQSKRMGIAWDNFVLSIENGEGAIGRSVVAIMGFFADLLDQINKTFNPTSIDEFLARLTSFDKADKIREINLAFDSGSKSFNSILNTAPTNSNVNALLKETQSTIKSTTEAYEKYKDAVNKGVLTDGGKAKLKDYESLLKNLRMKEYQLTLLGGANSPSGAPITFEETDADRKKTEAAQRALERKTEQARQAVERQRKLQGDIEALANQSTRNQLSRDESEIASIKDKYAKMRDEVRKFYADPKNKGFRIDEGKLKQAESFEVSEATTRQGTKELLKQLNEQKSIYDQYNAYVEQNGIKAAEKMFGEQADLAKDYRSNLEKEYFAISTLQKTAALAPFTGVNIHLTQAQEERAKELKQMLDAMYKEDAVKERAKYAGALQLAKTHAQKLEGIEKEHQQHVTALGKDATAEELENLKKARDEKIKSQNEEFFLKSDLYKKASKEALIRTRAELKEQIKLVEDLLKTDLAPNIKERLNQELSDLKINLSVGSVKTNISNLETQRTDVGNAISQYNIDNGIKEITDQALESHPELKKLYDLLKQITGQISKLKKEANDGPDGGFLGFLKKLEGNETLKEISEWGGVAAQSFSQMSQALGGTDTQAGYLLGTIGELAGAAADVAGAIASGDPKAIVKSAIGAISTVFSISKKTKEMNRQAREENQKFYDEAKKGEKEYQALLRQRELDTVARGKNSYNAIIAQLEAVKKQSPEVQKAYDKIFSSLQGQDYINGKGYEHGTWFRKAKTWDIMASLRGADYDKLEKLYSEGKLKDKAKEDFESLKALREELEEAGLSVEDLQKSLDELLTGTSSSGLASGLADLFENGKRSAQDFADSFESILGNAIKSSFQAKYLEDAMQPFYNELADLMEGGNLTEEQIQALKEKYILLGEEYAKKWEDIEKITGTGSSSDSSSTIKGKLDRELSEKTGGEIVGIFRAGYDIWKQQLVAIQAQSATNVNILAIANEKLIALNAIQVNTANTVQRLDVAVKHLDTIVKNTSKTGRSAEGMGL